MKKQLLSIAPIREQLKQALLSKFDSTIYSNTDWIDVRISATEFIDNYLKDKNIQEPIIHMTKEAFLKMRTLVDRTDSEIGWFGTVQKDNNVYTIDDIIVYPQKVTGVTCEQDEDKMFEFEMSLTDEQVNHRRFHGHSHVNMGTTPSGVDENCYEELLKQVTDFYIVIITNKKGEVYSRFYDVQNNVIFTEIPIICDITDWYEDTIDKNLAKKTYETKSTILKEADEAIAKHKTSKQMSYNDYYEDDWWDKKYGKMFKSKKGRY